MEKQFRTQEQFFTIAENVFNGNRKDAGQNCVDFGFYANDLLKANGTYVNGEYNGTMALDDLVLLAEMGAEARYKTAY